MPSPGEFDHITVASLRGTGSLKWTELGPGLLGAGVAEMDFGTAPAVVAALHMAVDRGQLGYLPDSVKNAARAACADWLHRDHGWRVAADDVQLLPDVVRALRVVIDHFSPPGSDVIVPTPAYPAFLHIPAMLGRRVIEVELVGSHGRYAYDLDALDHAFAAGGRLLVLCNPHNPTGHVLDVEELAAIGEVVARHGGRVFADEVHAPLVYLGHRHVPYASLSRTHAQHTITATSASKGWNLQGLKCAQVVLSNDADRLHWLRLDRLATDGTSTLGATAAAAAFRHGGSWLASVLAQLDRNRHSLSELMSGLLPTVSYRPPDGTYLAWLDCRSVATGPGGPAKHFAEFAGVSTLDGANCGRGGGGFVRLNFATTGPILASMAERLAASTLIVGRHGHRPRIGALPRTTAAEDFRI